MKLHRISPLAGAALLVLSGTVAVAQERAPRDENRPQDQSQRDDQNRQQAARDWYNQHQDHPARGFRNQDRLSADEESRLREGAPLDRSFQRRTYSVPRDLSRNLPKAPKGNRYVVIGGHVVMMDNRQQVKSVIHLHDNR